MTRDKIMQNHDAIAIGIQAITHYINEAGAETDTSDFTDALEILTELRKTEELRQTDHLSSSAEEALFAIFDDLEGLHWSQNITWIFTKPIWMTVRNAFICRTGLCLSRGQILKEYYAYRREMEEPETGEKCSPARVIDGLTNLFSEVSSIRRGD